MRGAQLRSCPALGSDASEKHASFGAGDRAPHRVDHIGVDREGGDPDSHEVVGELRPVGGRLAAERRADAGFLAGADDAGDGVEDGGVGLVEQAALVTTKPGGTSSPAAVSSPRLAPFPPARSALPTPKS